MSKTNLLENAQVVNAKEIRNQLDEQLVKRLAELRTMGIGVAETGNIDVLSVVVDQDLLETGICVPVDVLRKTEKLCKKRDCAKELIEGAKKDFHAFYGEKVICSGMICAAAKTFLNAFKAAYGSSVRIGANQYDWLRDNDIDMIAILATAMYLENWLSRDKENYQTPYGFVAHPYQVENRHEKKTWATPAQGEISRIERAYEQYAAFFEIRQNQAKEENARINTLPQYERKGDGRPVDLIVLAWCEAWVEGKLDLLDYLFYKKTVMELAEDRRSKKAVGLAEICSNYQDYIQSINNIDVGEKAPLCNIRKYVAASMMLHKLERTYRFHLYAKIANSVCQGELNLDKFNFFTWISFFGRYEASDDRLFMPAWAANAKTLKYTGLPEGTIEECGGTYVLSDESRDILNTEFYVRHMFEMDGEEQSYIEAELNILRRKLMLDLYIFLDFLYPLREQMSWNEEMFRDVVLFYRYSYSVAAELSQIVFPKYTTGNEKETNEFYRQFKSVYQKLEEVKDFPLAKGREFLQEKRKKEREKRKKSTMQ